MKTRPHTTWLAGAAGVCVHAILLASLASAQPAGTTKARIILLHHSTGECVWNGGVAEWFRAYNAVHGTRYVIEERNFPKDSPYGWENYPFDYWNIWVRHAGATAHKGEPTLEMLTRTYDTIILKHCFPVSSIEADTGRADVASREKRIENYKLQYAALKRKMRQFPRTRFIVWTGAALVRGETDEATARRAKAFFDWVRSDWDTRGDNIFLWDFHRLETEGGLYLKGACASGDSHPNERFSRKVAPLLCQRVVDVLRGRGDTGSITGAPARTSTGPRRDAGDAGDENLVPAKAEEESPESSASPRISSPAAPEPATAPTAAAVKLSPDAEGRWLFDNAEDKALAAKRWLDGAAYAEDGKNHVIRIDFTKGGQEDWGEYGRQRIVRSRPGPKNLDVKPFKYLAFRVKADRKMQVMLGLLTLPDPTGAMHQSHFTFSAYVHTQPARWTWVVLDLARLELGAEGDTAYKKAGEPTRPMELTALRFCVNQKHEKAAVALDDITFLRDLPPELKPFVQGASPEE